MLNPRNTFASLVVGPHNEAAVTAAYAWVKDSVRVGGLFLVTAAPALGKSHLAHAVGHALLARPEQLRVSLVPAEYLANVFLAAEAEGRLESYRQRFETVDALLVDDVALIDGQGAAARELMRLTLHLLGAGRRVLMTTDHSDAWVVRALSAACENRLTEVVIFPPRYEACVALLQTKAAYWNIALSPLAARRLARYSCNPRKLEGLLIRAAECAAEVGRTLSDLTGTELDELHRRFSVS